MAIMIPTSLDNLADTTAGERKLFSLFQNLPPTCVVRYEMLIGERDFRPDFVLIEPGRGILIVEVKDWGTDSIVKATPEQFWIQGMRGSKTPKPVRNPDGKCQTYLRHAREQLAAMPVLRDASGRMAVPVAYFVAFPNISQAEFRARGLDQLMSVGQVLFQEDLHKNGIPFQKRYEKALPSLPAALSQEQQQAITAALLPDIAIPIGSRLISEQAGIVNLDQEVIDTYNLSLDQEQIAKSLGEGPRLLRGIAGTGKTLIMLYRAKLLAANDPEGKLRILILCWNISLANYMRQAFERLNIQAEGKQVVIKHFADFCRGFLKRPLNEEFDDPAFTQALLRVQVSQAEQYDAIYIDEAQDFRKEWIEFLYHHLLRGTEPAARNLLIAADDAQRIYPKRDFSWSDLAEAEETPRLRQQGQFKWSSIGIPMRGRTKILKTIYRNSARVWIFAAFLLGDEASYVQKSAEKVRFSAKGGFDPQLVECTDPMAQIEEAVKIIKRVTSAGYAARNILILYRHRTAAGFSWVETLLTRLERENIPHQWIAEGQETKSTFEWEANTVKISTVHSAKGMDSPIVIVLGAETFVEKPDQDETRLMYVALTRAREFLVVLHSGDKGLVPQLHACQEKYLKFRDQIINQFEM